MSFSGSCHDLSGRPCSEKKQGGRSEENAESRIIALAPEAPYRQEAVRQPSDRGRICSSASPAGEAAAQARRGQPLGPFLRRRWGPLPFSLGAGNMAAAAGRAFLRGIVRGLLLPRLAGGTPGPERDFSLSHNRVRATSEHRESSPLVGLFTPKYRSGGPRLGKGCSGG